MSRRRARRAGSTDTCFTCAILLVVLGMAAALYVTRGHLSELPTWAKVGGPLAALLLLALAFFSGGSGFTSTGDGAPGVNEDAPPESD